MRVGILFNCQHAGLAAALRGLVPDLDVISHELGQAKRSTDAMAATAAELNACDAVISSGAGAAWGALSTSALRYSARQFHVVPTVTFAGYHPDMVTVLADKRYLGGPTGLYHARLGIVGFLAGFSVEDTAALYGRLAFARLGYFGAVARSAALLQERYAAVGIALGPSLDRWMSGGCFMHSMNHPKAHVLRDVGIIAAGLLGLPFNAETPAGEDTLAHFETHPIYPAIAAALGIAAEPAFTLKRAPGSDVVTMSLEAFLAASFAMYERTPRKVLRDVDGVTAGLRALDLRE